MSTVRLKDHPRYRNHYLHWSIQGQQRSHKAFEKWLIGRGIMANHEFAVPAAGVRLNASGNMSPGTITAILSQLQVSPDAMQWETARSRKRAAKKGRARYFVPQRGSKLPRGIWQRKGKTSIAPVLFFVSAVNYSKQYDFHGISQREAERRFPALFGAALSRAIATRK